MGPGAREPRVSVIVPVRNGAELIDDQLSALAGQTYAGPWELLVSDNGSTDASREIALGWADRIPDLRVVDSGARRGPSAARNIAVAEAAGDLLLFCDADDRVSSGWIEAMVEGLERCEMVTGPVTLVSDDGGEVSRSREVPRYVGRYPYASGASLGVRRALFDELGGFDTSIPGSSSTDVEFGLRVTGAGHEIAFVDGAGITKRRRDGAAEHVRAVVLVRTGRSLDQPSPPPVGGRAGRAAIAPPRHRMAGRAHRHDPHRRGPPALGAHGRHDRRMAGRQPAVPPDPRLRRATSHPVRRMST